MPPIHSAYSQVTGLRTPDSKPWQAFIMLVVVGALMMASSLAVKNEWVDQKLEGGLQAVMVAIIFVVFVTLLPSAGGNSSTTQMLLVVGILVAVLAWTPFRDFVEVLISKVTTPRKEYFPRDHGWNTGAPVGPDVDLGLNLGGAFGALYEHVGLSFAYGSDTFGANFARSFVGCVIAAFIFSDNWCGPSYFFEGLHHSKDAPPSGYSHGYITTNWVVGMCLHTIVLVYVRSIPSLIAMISGSTLGYVSWRATSPQIWKGRGLYASQTKKS